jgi:hypothetical protein
LAASAIFIALAARYSSYSLFAASIFLGSVLVTRLA